MNNKKIAEFIKKKRKEKKMTQAELAEKLFVTEKAVSRWETGRGTPDVSLLIPLSEVLDVTVSDILKGESKNKEKDKKCDDVKEVINYVENNRKGKFNIPLLLSILCYVISILVFLFYLKYDYTNYNPWGLSSLDYLMRLLMVVVSSVFILLGNYIFSNNYVDKISDKDKIKNVSNIIIFIYYCILLFNLGIFARREYIDRINLVPFKTIYDMFLYQNADTFLINIVGNLLVFMPVQYFLIELFKVKKFSKNFIISFLIILFFEVVQLIFKIGVFDIDDIILCLSGMIIFYFLYNKFKSFKRKKVWIIFIAIFLALAFLGYNLIYYISINYDYNEERMSCVVKEDKIVYDFFGTNLVSTDYTFRKVDNQVYVFLKGKVKLTYLLEEKQQYKDSLKYKEENQDKYDDLLYGSHLWIDLTEDLDVDANDIVKVYYMDDDIHDVEIANEKELFKIIDKSNYMCSSE